MNVSALHRFPVKGLSGESLESVDLRAGFGFPLDRIFAVTDGSLDFDESRPAPAPKTQFLMLARHERLARLRTRLRSEDSRLSIEEEGGPSREFSLDIARDRSALADFLGAYVGVPLPGSPRVVRADGHQFTDVSVLSVALMRSISLINLDTVRSLSEELDVKLDPLRFRGNLLFEGVEPWAELEWVGRTLLIDDVVLRVVLRTQRCAATSVDPRTGVRDINVPLAIRKNRDHGDLGVYAEVVHGGVIRRGASMWLQDTPATGSKAEAATAG
jgi:uncharacterized protein YcbX